MFGLFKKNKVINEDVSDIEIKKEVAPKIKIMDRPKIFCIDIEDDDIAILESSGFNIETGTLGKKVEIPNNNINDEHFVLPNRKLVNNLHEYDITIIDLHNDKTIKYKEEEEHQRENYTGNVEHTLLSMYPETLFNPKPFGSASLNRALNKLGGKKHLILNFTTSAYSVEYNYVKIEKNGWNKDKIEKEHIYKFSHNVPLSEIKMGKDIVICDVSEELKKLLISYQNEFIYNQTFDHPAKWEEDKRILDKNYLPLIENINEDIVSIAIFEENKTIFHFPQIKNKGKFLNEFLTTVAPKILPELFPSLTTFQWKNDKAYWLPNHEKLLQEKEQLEIEYKKRLLKKEKQIKSNLEKYQFLQQLITETGDSLVIALIQYFKWLGFEDVKDMDEQKSEDEVFEEDIQIVLDNGLLIIEIKGIGGTSKDSDCSQVSKIKHRRCEERGAFDVSALYVVNHQRYLPPYSRKNPPFTSNQIKDAKHDKRGLVTTWQLYNLYFDIEKELITKDVAKKLLLEYGLVDFKPQNLLYIDTTKEILFKGKVCIVNIENIELKVGNILFFEKNDKYQKVIILDIQLNGSSLESVNNGELGLKLSEAIKKNSKVYKQEL